MSDKTPVQESYAKLLVQDEDAIAKSVFVAFKRIFGERAPVYEPDTLRKAAKDFGLKIPDTNFDKFQAAATLLATPTFFWEVNTFEQTVRAFNGLEIDVDALYGAHPAELAWGCIHALSIAKGSALARPVEGDLSEYIDYEPLEYVTLILLNEGYVVAPRGLGWAQERLDELCKSHCDLKNDVQKRWLALEKGALADTSFEESPVGVQLARLASCEVYVREKEKQLAAELQRLHSPE